MSKKCDCSIQYSGLNRLTKANFENMLHQKKSVLTMWYTQDCKKCGMEIWDVYYAISLYMDTQDVFILLNM